MPSNSAPLVVGTDRGLYCPPGKFHIDPWLPVQTALITHAHGDHLRHGSARYIVARPGATIARHRLGSGSSISAFDYGVPFRMGKTHVSLHAAGHILGSAQVRIEHEGEIWVVSGDYKRQADPTCAPFEPLACNVFISEATFGQPLYRWPPPEQVAVEILQWWRANRDRGIASALFCYALGKAQRVLAELRAHTNEPIYLHKGVAALTDLYRRAGIQMVPTLPATAEQPKEYRGALVIAPPAAAGTPWMRRIGEHTSALCSGWMCVEGEAQRRGYDRGFVISDHADWPGLLDTCLASGAHRVLLTHGNAGELARTLNERGVLAEALQTPGYRP